MKLTNEDVERYAQKAARLYVSKYGETRHIDRDDAFSIAYFEIYTHSEYDERYTELERSSYFVKRGYNAIVQKYNKIHKPQKKNGFTIISIENLEESLEYVPQEKTDDHRREELQKWIDKLSSPKEADVIRSVIAGKSKSEIAREAQISNGRISQIVKQFIKKVRLAIMLKENLVCVGGEASAEAKQLFPLFFN